jgi:hypothetical protein
VVPYRQTFRMTIHAPSKPSCPAWARCNFTTRVNGPARYRRFMVAHRPSGDEPGIELHLSPFRTKAPRPLPRSRFVSPGSRTLHALETPQKQMELIRCPEEIEPIRVGHNLSLVHPNTDERIRIWP